MSTDNNYAGIPHGTLVSYVTGFVFSILLTLDAFLFVSKHLLDGMNLILAIAGLAVAQLIVQLVFFLHLGKEKSPRWNLQVFVFMLGVLLTIVFGSLWIMNNLDYHHAASPSETDQSIIKDEGYNP